MTRLSEILRKEEIQRAYFYEHKPASEDKPGSGSGSITAEQLYKQLLNLMRQVFLDILNAKKLDITLLKDKINLLSDFIAKDDASLSRLIDRYDNLDDYLAVHGVNVCILSLEIARGLDYSREEMLDLGLGAFLHDTGMIQLRSILQNKRRLYTAEYEEVKNHVTYGVELLNNLCPINDRVSSIISQHHERRDGSGYLKRLKAGQIGEYAQIVGLADVYDALIHSRPHRNRLMPFEPETIRVIVSHKDMFEPYILRVFLERLTHHPGYMLWLAADGIYELLRQQQKIKPDLPDKPEIRAYRPKRPLLILPAALLITIFLIGVFILKSHLIIPQREIFYPLGSSLGIADNRQPLKINYNFTSNISSTPSVSLGLSGINLEGYHFLTFLARLEDKKLKKRENATLKIVLENTRKETASYYLQGINNRWREFRIPLSYFDAVKDWSSVASLSFILQPWNINSQEGALYIDDIHFFRKK